MVLRSRDRGDSWEEISSDLTTDNPDKIDGHGNIQVCTITTLAESTLTRNDGENWTDLTGSLEAAGAPRE